MRRYLAASAALTLSLLAPASAAAGEILSTDVSVADAVKRSCIDAPLSGGQGYAARTATAPASGWVSARLNARSGDWDVAIFNTVTRQRVAGSAAFGASEIAEGFVARGDRLTVQACRRSGAASSAKLTLESDAVKASAPQELSLVRVATPSAARKDELTRLGLDLTEHGGAGFVEVLLHGADDAKALREAKFIFTTTIGDLAAAARRDRAAEQRAVASGNVRAAAFPSGRTGTYRRLDDYNNEMKQLAEANPGIVKPITLPERTFLGRTVQGIEISENVRARDGKPVFFQMGVHHAREWPSGEHAMEWAYELINGYKARDSRVVQLMGRTRTIVVPIINPDGFNTSREAGQATGRPGGGSQEIANLATPYEYQRKNCRINNTAPDDFDSTADDDPAEGDCVQAGKPNVGITQFGVDPNRNYGGFWGGPGASPSGDVPGGDFAQDYRGTGPFSEPETRNVRDLVSKRQVTTLITNHTFSNLVLRPPGIQAQGPSVDEPVYKALGDSMAAENGYASNPSYTLYDTTGGTEDWTYYATGSLGFTFEIGLGGFHPLYADTVAEYEGTTVEAGEGGGNREAYFKALENTANASRHSVIKGGAFPGAVLRLKKSFTTFTSPVIDADGVPGRTLSFPDVLDTTMEVPASGDFEWHINPSTRPVADQDIGRPPNGGAPSAPTNKSGTASQPPCPLYFEAPNACLTGVTDEVFEIPAQQPGAVDNGFATIKLAFPEEADLDLEIYKADSAGKATGAPVSSSASGSNPEQATIGPDPDPGKYVARVINYTGGTTYDLNITFAGPRPFKPGVKETWTLTCEGVDGKVAQSRQVQIDRGEVKTESFGAPCAKVAAAAIEKRDCLPTKGGVRPRALGKARLGRTRSRQRRALGAKRLKSHKGIDRYCVRGGGEMRIGYPTKRLSSKISKRSRKRVRRKAVLAISSSKRFRVNRLRAGTSVRALRERLRGEQRYRVGRSVWFMMRGKRSRLLFRTQKGKVREVGLADKALTSTKLGTQRFLRAWDRRGL